MSATIHTFPGRGTPMLRRDERLLCAIGEVELRFEQILRYVREGDLANAEALAITGALEASELEGIVLGVDQ